MDDSLMNIDYDTMTTEEIDAIIMRSFIDDDAEDDGDDELLDYLQEEISCEVAFAKQPTNLWTSFLMEHHRVLHPVSFRSSAGCLPRYSAYSCFEYAAKVWSVPVIPLAVAARYAWHNFTSSSITHCLDFPIFLQ